MKNLILFHLGRGLLALLSHCPEAWIRPLGRALGALGAILARRERRRAIQNIARSDLNLNGVAQERLLHEVFARFGQSLLEALALERLRSRLAGGEGEVNTSWVSWAAPSVSLVRRSGGAVVVTAHLGNFELLAAAIAAQRGEPLFVLAKRSYDPRFSAILEARRRALGVIPLWVEEKTCALQALRALRRGAWVGILVDRAPRLSGVARPFLGREAPTEGLAAGLARASGVPVHVALIQRGAGGESADRHRVSVAPLAAPGTEEGRVTDLITRRLEAEIRRRPEDWLWTLDRWRDEDRQEARDDDAP